MFWPHPPSPDFSSCGEQNAVSENHIFAKYLMYTRSPVHRGVTIGSEPFNFYTSKENTYESLLFPSSLKVDNVVISFSESL